MRIHEITSDSSVGLYYGGDTEGESVIHSLLEYTEGTFVYCEASPFSPRAYFAGDQPGDTGVLIVENKLYSICSTETFITDSLTSRIVYPASKSHLDIGTTSRRYNIHIGHFIMDDGFND